MARFSAEELDNIRRDTDIVVLIESYGTKLNERPTANEYVGCCPLHDDSTPSLFVNRAKGLWQCKGACGCGGDCFKWIEKAEKVSFRHAVELLQNKAVGVLAGNGTKAQFSRRLESPIEFAAEDNQILAQVSDYYHSRLSQSPDAIAYLQSRGLDNRQAIDQFKIGFCDRTLGLRLPSNQYKAGKDIRTRLSDLGVIKETGHEALRGCITFPIPMLDGTINKLYGRRILKGTAKHESHWYLKGPHLGIWNPQAFQATDEIILCESIIDALTFWIAGYRNVTTSFGNQGFTENLYQAFIQHDIKKIMIAWDNDDESNKLIPGLAAKLISQGIDGYRVLFPAGTKDANEFAMKVKDGNGTAHGSLGMLLRNAERILPTNHKPEPIIPEPMALATGDATTNVSASKEKKDIFGDMTFREALASGVLRPVAPSSTSSPAVTITPTLNQESGTTVASLTELGANDNQQIEPATKATSTNEKQLLLLEAQQAVGVRPEAVGNAIASAEPMQARPSMPKGIEATISDNEVIITIGNRTYRIRGLGKSSTTFDTMKINILARKGEDAFFVDTIDIYAARNRNHFVKEAARELGLEEEIIKRDLGKILLKLEELQDSQSLSMDASKNKNVEISEADKAKAIELLRSPTLIQRILSDFNTCGVVGEETNKLIGYLAATSRKLSDPLAILIQSSSAAGKSSMMDAVLAFMPSEEVVKYSAMTGQSLFYMGGTDLKHRILAIAEEEGVAQAAYALKLLQSDKKINIASTGKDPGTGRMVDYEYLKIEPCQKHQGKTIIYSLAYDPDNNPVMKSQSGLIDINRLRIVNENEKSASSAGEKISKVGPSSDKVGPEKIDQPNENIGPKPIDDENTKNDQQGAA